MGGIVAGSPLRQIVLTAHHECVVVGASGATTLTQWDIDAQAIQIAQAFAVLEADESAQCSQFRFGTLVTPRGRPLAKGAHLHTFSALGFRDSSPPG